MCRSSPLYHLITVAVLLVALGVLVEAQDDYYDRIPQHGYLRRGLQQQGLQNESDIHSVTWPPDRTVGNRSPSTDGAAATTPAPAPATESHASNIFSIGSRPPGHTSPPTSTHSSSSSSASSSPPGSNGIHGPTLPSSPSNKPSDPKNQTRSNPGHGTGNIHPGPKDNANVNARKKSKAVLGQNGSLGRINATIVPGRGKNEGDIEKETTRELQIQLDNHFGGNGRQRMTHKSIEFDEDGGVHLRYKQIIDGMEVEGAAVMVHVQSDGTILAINGEFLDDDETSLLHAYALQLEQNTNPQDLLDQALVEAGIQGGQWVGEEQRAVVRRMSDGSACLAWKRLVEYTTAEKIGFAPTPHLDMIFADALYSGAIAQIDDSNNNNTNSTSKGNATTSQNSNSGALCARHPQYYDLGIPLLETFDCHDLSTNCSLVPQSRDFNSSQSDDSVVDATRYANATYYYYDTNFQRNSLDAYGMPMRSRVHFGNRYNNAFWDGSEATFGDGDGVNFGPFSRAADVVGHEFTHGVTQFSSSLLYRGESGALNEAISDIFGAMVNRQEHPTDEDIWQLGKDIVLPGYGQIGIRNMADPAEYGQPDFYPECIFPGEVHNNSGIASLAFKLLVTGGSHPRNKTNINVTGIGFEAASRIFYYANIGCLTQHANYAMARFCTADVYGFENRSFVHQAWDAVGVPNSSFTVLKNGDALSGQSSSSILYYSLSQNILKGERVFCNTSAPNGDADLYVRFGAYPQILTYLSPDNINDCTSDILASSNETCITGEAPSDVPVYIAVHAYSPFTDLTIECLIEAPPPTNAPTLTPTKTPTKPPTKPPTQPPTNAPVVPATPRPTQPTVTVSSIGNSGGGHRSKGCFSDRTLLTVLGKGLIPMRELKIGDKVLMATKKGLADMYEPVYGFGYYHPTKSTEFVQIFYDVVSNGTMDHNSLPLEMTGKHLLYIEGRANPIRADSVQVGDLLKHQSHPSAGALPIQVTKIGTVWRKGVYAPFTPSGNIVVHEAGIVVSNYISLQDTATEYVELQHAVELQFLSQQALCHAWMIPYRTFCMFHGQKYCRGESYTDQGRSFWVHLGKSFSEWGEQQILPVQCLVLAMVISTLLLAFLVEGLLKVPLLSQSLIVVCAIVSLLIVRKQKRHLQ